MSSKRILALYDNEDMLDFFKEFLESHGFKVDTTMDTQRALAEYKPGMYDLILLNTRLPGMPGIKFIQKVNEIDTRVKVLFVTPLDCAEALLRPILKAGQDFLMMPVLPTKLLDRINEMLESNPV